MVRLRFAISHVDETCQNLPSRGALLARHATALRSAVDSFSSGVWPVDDEKISSGAFRSAGYKELSYACVGVLVLAVDTIVSFTFLDDFIRYANPKLG